MRLSEEQMFIIEHQGLTPTCKVIAILDLAGYTEQAYHRDILNISRSTWSHNIKKARAVSAAARRGVSDDET